MDNKNDFTLKSSQFAAIVSKLDGLNLSKTAELRTIGRKIEIENFRGRTQDCFIYWS